VILSNVVVVLSEGYYMMWYIYVSSKADKIDVLHRGMFICRACLHCVL